MGMKRRAPCGDSRRNALLAERTRVWEVRRAAVAWVHERARWKRADDAHQRSRRRVEAFD
jgi:hypothetical protein